MIKNMVGLEAEFLLTDGNELVFPSDYGFETDEYIILGEFRGEPSDKISEVISSFQTKFYEVLDTAKKNKLELHLSGYAAVDSEFHAKILRRMGTKEISQSKNIYGTDILTLSDSIIQKGKVVGHYISTGLHIHFSSNDSTETNVTIPANDIYDKVTIPVAVFEGKSLANIELYRKTGNVSTEYKTKLTARANRITKPVINYFVAELDHHLLNNYKLDVPLKFRRPGYYETKYYGGFEYRSLPFNNKTLADIYTITSFCFSLFDNL